MAYVAGNLRLIYDPANGSAPKFWSYRTSDTPKAVAAAGYITNAPGMKVGDIVEIQQTNNSYASTRAVVATMAAGVPTLQLEAGAGYLPTEGGSGLDGIAEVYATAVERIGGLIRSSIFIDLTGLNSSATGDIIGDDAAANCHLGQITAARNGTVHAGLMTCLETPLTGEPDIDLFSADEATGTEDTAVTALTETSILTAGADWTIDTQKAFGAVAADQYLYLVGQGAGTDATYTAGKFLIELYGY